MWRRAYEYIRLQLRLVWLAMRNRWIGTADVAQSYDRLAEKYDSAWLAHLTPVTDTLLSSLTGGVNGHIIDLGCGTGYSSAWLARENPDAHITLVDCSAGMLARAQQRVPVERATIVCDDMLTYLRQQRTNSASLIFSGWAIGYSYPTRIIREAGRVLVPGGAFAFVVNTAETLRPIFLAFWACMLRYPSYVRKTINHHFPRRWEILASALSRAHFEITWQHTGAQPIVPTVAPDAPLLPWLYSTGILAGFDSMLPLREHPDAAAYFESLLAPQRDQIYHCYFAAIGIRE